MRAHRSTLALLVITFLVTACGASAKEIKTAKQGLYQTDYAVVWRAVREEFVARYAHLADEQPEAGIIVSIWQWYDMAGTRKSGERVLVGPDDVLVRFAVQIIKDETNGDWRVVADAGAQGHLPGSPKAIPISKDAQPDWVQDRVDTLTVAIYERLKKYDTNASPAPQ